MYRTTSRDADDSIEPRKIALRAQVFALLLDREQHGATDEEIQIELKMKGSTERPRRGELEESGDVVDSGRTRKTLSNRAAIVWMATRYEKVIRQQKLF